MEIQYFHIEGVDLAGKTSATKSLSMILGDNCKTRRNTLQEKSQFHKIVDDLRIKDGLGEKELGLLYCKVLEDDLRKFEYPTQNTIQDSTVLLRSLSYHCACENWDLVDEFKQLLPLHPKFTKSVVLTADLDSRLKRLEMRKVLNPEEVANDDLMIITDPDRFFLMERYLIEVAETYFSAKVLDTSNLAKHEVFECIKEYFSA
jgi:thymidylate kinase